MHLRQINVARRSGSLLAGVLVYRTHDHAFAFSDEGPGGLGAPTAPLVIGTLQLEVDCCTGRVLYAWGYSPAGGWQQSSPFEALIEDSGQAFVEGIGDLSPGVGIGLVDASTAVSLVDPFSRSVRVIDPDGIPTAVFMIAPGVGLLLAGSWLLGVQLSPANFDAIPRSGGPSPTAAGRDL